jgi:hypothetical membrane protein
MLPKAAVHPQKIAGGLLTTAGALILMGIITAEALYTAPYNTRMEISDLGATDTGFILHPSSYIFNATMVAAGAMIVIGASYLHRAFHRRAVTMPTGLLGIGVLGVGIFPGNIHPYHPLFAFTAFLAGGVAVLLSSKVTPQPLRTIVAVMGVVSLLSTVASVFLLDWGPIARLDLGGVERWMVYPVVLWLVGFGSYLTASHPAEDPELASSLAGPASAPVSQPKELVSSSR